MELVLEHIINELCKKKRKMESWTPNVQDEKVMDLEAKFTDNSHTVQTQSLPVFSDTLFHPFCPLCIDIILNKNLWSVLGGDQRAGSLFNWKWYSTQPFLKSCFSTLHPEIWTHHQTHSPVLSLYNEKVCESVVGWWFLSNFLSESTSALCHHPVPSPHPTLSF